MHYGDYGWGMGFGWVFMLAFWALVIIVIFFLVKTFMSGSGRTGGGETALDILQKRYAKGEITKEEYEKVRNDLKKD